MTTAVAPGIRLVAARRFAGLQLVGRPHSPVAHLYLGPLTRSGAAVPSARRAVCRAATRRLRVVPWGDLGAGRRVCRRCLPLLPAAAGRDVPQLVSRDDYQAAFTGLTVADLTQAVAWTRSAAETHQVGYLTGILHAPASRAPLERLTGGALARRQLDDAISARRAHWAIRELPLEEREAALRARETEAVNAQIREHGRRRQARRDRLYDHARSGGYVAAWELDRAAG